VEDQRVKITEVIGYALTVPGKEYRWIDGLAGEGKTRDIFLLRILSDTGLEGNCIWHHEGHIMVEVAQDVFKSIVGDDPLDREYIWQKIWYLDRIKYMPIHAQGCLDVALWDLGAKAAGLPLYKFIGAARHKIQAYASTLSYSDLETYRELSLDCIKRGYNAIKLHVTGDVRRDIEICRLVRSTVGENYKLMLDVNGKYNHEEAIWAGRELEKLEFSWFEEPVRDYDMYGLQELRKKLNIPILTAETSHGTYFDVANQIRNRTADIIHTDWYIKAGITGVMKTAHLCEANGITCQVHGPGLPNLHAALCISNCEFYEQIVPEDMFHFLQLNEPTKPDREGFVSAPDEPGLGMRVDWEQVEKYKVVEV
jgi:L-alanine-DL-glutamate epimerase-like enolase superfamily enzyme